MSWNFRRQRSCGAGHLFGKCICFKGKEKLWKNAGNTCLIEVNTCLNMFGATLTLLRAGIAEGLRIFEMPCQWTFNMHVIHDDDDDCKCGGTSGLDGICFIGMYMVC